MIKAKFLIKKNILRMVCTGRSLKGFPFAAAWPFELFSELTLFYNSFGRRLFCIFQAAALITKGRMFRKKILLEYFDKIDYANLCKGAFQESLYSTSPFSPRNIKQEQDIPDELVARIELSYRLAYDDDPKRLPQSQWWEEMSGEFRKAYFDGKGRLKVETLKDFRGRFTSRAQILSDQLESINPEKGYAYSYKKSLQVVLQYHRMSDYIDHAILKSVSESFAGNNKCPVYRGQRLSVRLLKHAYYLSQIRKNTELRLDDDVNILDLGGAYGGLARLLSACYSKSKIFVIELPEVCVFAAYFLSQSLPRKKIAFYSDLKFEGLKDIRNTIKMYDIFVLPAWSIEFMPESFFDLVINTTSLGEMSREYGRYYIAEIERICRGYFYSNNRPFSGRKDLGYDDFGFLNWNLKNQWFSIIYNYSLTGHIEWLGRILK